MDNYKSIQSLVKEGGASLFGVACVKPFRNEFFLPAQTLEGLDKGISVGVRLSRAVLSTIEDSPTKIYYHHYRQLNSLLDRIALNTVSFIQEKGKRALPIPASQIIDWEKQQGHLSHKKVAQAAGLGWIGRNNLLVNPEFGSQVRFVTVLTDMDLPCGEPIEKDCEECKGCIDACPAGAIKESRSEFDYISCFEKLKGFRNKGLVGQFICGVCVKVCNGEDLKKSKKHLTPAFNDTKIVS